MSSHEHAQKEEDSSQHPWRGCTQWWTQCHYSDLRQTGSTSMGPSGDADMRSLPMSQNPPMGWGLSFAKRVLPQCCSRTQTLGAPALKSKGPSKCRISFWTISYDNDFHDQRPLMSSSWLYLILFLSHLHLRSPRHRTAESHHFIICGIAKAGACQGTAWCWRICISSGHSI